MEDHDMKTYCTKQIKPPCLTMAGWKAKRKFRDHNAICQSSGTSCLQGG